MDVQDDPLRCAVPIPGPGCTVRLARGELNLTIERSSGGLRIEVDDGLSVLRHFVGFPGTGRLELHAAVPGETLLVRLRDAIVLAPAARLRGYLTVPCLQQLVLRRPDGGAEPLLAFSPGSLRLLWAGAAHGYSHAVPSRFDLWLDRASTGIAVPIQLRNLSAKTWRPFELALTLEDACLRNLRGRVCAAPLRITHLGSGPPVLEVRRWRRSIAAA